MKYQFILAGLAISQAAEARLHGSRHGRTTHDKRALEVIVEREIVTQVVTVTVHAAAAASAAPGYAYANANANMANTKKPKTTLSTKRRHKTKTTAVTPTATYPATQTTQNPAPTNTGVSKGNLTPNGIKAGLSGYINIQYYPGFAKFAPYISWYSDYTSTTPSVGNVMGVGMLWGAAGSSCETYGPRLQAYNGLIANSTPEIMFGFYEPDCTCEMSAEMSVADSAAAWDTLIAPLGAKGTVLGSPSMCKQYDEDFLTPFNSSISTSWDVTSIHVNKPSLAEAQADVDYYWKKYGKPIWVSEFACVNDHPNFDPCTDRAQITQFINDVVPYFENDPRVVAYGPSNGEGLGTVWPLTDSTTGDLTETGMTYLNALQALQS